MPVIDQLASSLNSRKKTPNQILAKKIVSSNDTAAIIELVDHLANENKSTRADCIKTLYEIGYKKPLLIFPFLKNILLLLDDKQNNLVWGAMIALDSIATVNLKSIYSNLSKIIDAMEKGSVVAKDHGMYILIKLASSNKYKHDVLPLLLSEIKISAVNQLAMYAEKSLKVIDSNYKNEFIQILRFRLAELPQETKRKRIEKVIKLAQQIK